MKYTWLMSLLIATCLAGAAHAELVWKWTDKGGNVQYGSQPPAGAKAVQVDAKAAKIGTVAPSRQTPPPLQAGRAVARSIAGGKAEAGPTGVRLRPEDSSPVCPPVMKSCVKKGERANSQPAPAAPPIVDKNGVIRD